VAKFSGLEICRDSQLRTAVNELILNEILYFSNTSLWLFVVESANTSKSRLSLILYGFTLIFALSETLSNA